MKDTANEIESNFYTIPIKVWNGSILSLHISQWQTLVLHYHGNYKLVSFSEVKAKNLIHLSYSQLITHFV